MNSLTDYIEETKALFDEFVIKTGKELPPAETATEEQVEEWLNLCKTFIEARLHLLAEEMLKVVPKKDTFNDQGANGWNDCRTEFLSALSAFIGQKV